MPTYVTLSRWTDQGIRNARDTVTRLDQAKQRMDQMGARFVGFYYTQGAYDQVAIVEAPDDETATAFLLATGMQGNVRTETMRAFSPEEMQRILQKLPQG